MGLFSNRHTRISKRLQTIQKELTGVNSDIGSLTRSVEKNGDEVVGEELKRMKRRRATRVSYSQDYPTPANHAPETEAASPGPEQEFDFSAPQPRTDSVKNGEEEQFASYFMSGGLERQEPLRKERHVQRNKAIFMVIFFVIVLALFAYFMLSR